MKLRLLLIEHDPGFARYVREMLDQARNLAPEVTVVSDLAGGLSALAASEFDVVLLDLALPDGAGLANLGLVREVAPSVPVVLGGESEDEALTLQAMEAGAADYILKGQLNPAWLERSIRYALQRHRMDRALLEAEQKYHSIFDHLVEGIFQTTADGHYLMANAALARIYGYETPAELVAELTDISRRLYVREGRRDEFIRRMQADDLLTDFESEVYRKDGSIIWISENCRAIRDASGRLLYYEGTVEDITQRRIAELKLRHSEALYHSLVETLPQNIFRKNVAGRFTFANRKFCETLGRPLEDILGKTDFDFFPPELAAKYQRDDRRILETGTPFDTVEEHQPPGSHTLYVRVVKTPIYESRGEIIGLQGIFWDITEERIAEEKIRHANAELKRSRRELHLKNVQMEDDLKMAREIQHTMLPQQYPSFPRAPGDPGTAFRFMHRYLPTGSVGGDFFTVSALSETQAAVFLCDVAGHGVRSALVTAMVRALVEELKPMAANPGEFLTKLNQDLCTILKHAGTPLLTTAFYLVADWASGAMRYANAGHPKPFHVRTRARQVVPLSNASGQSQPALGLIEDAVYQSSEIILTPQDVIFLFTDGLVEVQNAQGELYHHQHLQAALEQRIPLQSRQFLDELLEEISSFTGQPGFNDDVCLVGMELTQPQLEV